MALYGYHISNLPRQEKFEEVESYLDKKLKGWEKPGTAFEKDGTIRQRYINRDAAPDNQTCDENGEKKDYTEVVLVKNITECNITVYSDIELKFLKFDGKLLLLRDLIPMTIFAAVQWLLMGKLLSSFAGTIIDAKYFAISALLVFVQVIINFATEKKLHVRRNMIRVRFIQYGGFFNALPFIYLVSKLFARWSLKSVLKRLLPAPIFVVSVAMIITCLIYNKMSKR